MNRNPQQLSARSQQGRSVSVGSSSALEHNSALAAGAP